MKFSTDRLAKKALKHFLEESERWTVLLEPESQGKHRSWCRQTSSARPGWRVEVPDERAEEFWSIAERASAGYKEIAEDEAAIVEECGVVIGVPWRSGGLRKLGVGPRGIYCVYDGEYIRSAYRLLPRTDQFGIVTEKEFRRTFFVARGLNKLSRRSVSSEELSAITTEPVLSSEDMTQLRSYFANYLLGKEIPERFQKMLDALMVGHSDDTKEIIRRIEESENNYSVPVLQPDG